ncbi:MAG: MocR-like pyridoxine biosynthesis transcription factor PdxR [Candidatus Krumholzibacteriia bacterium]
MEVVPLFLIALDRQSPLPVYRQICDRIAALVDDRTLRPGDRLPPTRLLARTAGVHRSTVVRAYEELAALGYLDSRCGAYSTVRRRARPPATRAAAAAGRADTALLDWAALTTPGGRAVFADLSPAPVPDVAPPGAIDLSRLTADPALAPHDELRRCLKSVLARAGGAALDYGDAAGWPPLRETIAARMRVHGIAVTADEVLVTAGAQQAMDLALRLLTAPGDRVAVEAPTYGMAHALLRLHRLTPLEIPLRDDGLDLDALAAALRRRRPKLVYTMPNFHNPTGITTGQAHRERLLALCEEHRVPLLEDGFEEEMKYFGQAVLPIKSMDARGVVLYVGTFSKVVFPGLRIGWLAAPRAAIARLAAIQRASCLTGNTLAQAAAARFCAGAPFEVYLRRAHRTYRRRMETLLRALADEMPPGVTWTRPPGGFTLWLRLPGTADDEAPLCARAAGEGVLIAPGRRFFARRPPTPHARLSITCADEGQIQEACRRLGRALTVPGRPG